MRFLDGDGKSSFSAELESDNWYSVIENNNTIVVFQIINVCDQYSKNLEIRFHPNYFNNTNNIVDVVLFIYSSMIDVCENKNIQKLKLHIKDATVKDIFDIIVTYQEKGGAINNAKRYKNWIEFEIKSSIK